MKLNVLIALLSLSSAADRGTKIDGYTRDKGTCRNAENLKKWDNQAYYGQQPTIEACK